MSLTQRSGFLCLFIAVLLACGTAEPCGVTSPGSCPGTDQTTLLQRQVDVAATPMVEEFDDGVYHDESVASFRSDGDEPEIEEDEIEEDENDGSGVSGGTDREDVIERAHGLLQEGQNPNDTDIECSDFETADRCHEGGCTWDGDSCELDPPNPDDTDIECVSFTTESHCGDSGCVWKNGTCEEDQAEQADALLQDRVPAAIEVHEDESDIADAGTTWCRRRRVHRRRWRSWGCRRRRAKPTVAKAPKDGRHKECWTAGGCKDNGKAPCGWCGQHNGQLMFCCSKGSTYASAHACKGAVFGTATNHVCVTPGVDSGASILAYKWLDLSGATASQLATSHGAAASRAIDGSASPQWGHGSCTHTYKRDNPWWQVDLKTPEVIKAVSLTNRGDCCGSRLDGFTVKVGNEVCASGVKIAQGETKMVTCKDVPSAKSIRVFVPKREHFTICEFRAATQAVQTTTTTAPPTQAPTLFDRMDLDSSEGISRAEFQKAVDAGDVKEKVTASTAAPTTQAPTPSPAATKAIFDKIDLDNDGGLTRDEIQKALDAGDLEVP